MGPELIPLIALRQRYGAPAAQLRTVEAPYRLAGFQVNQANQDAPSANPWSGMSESQYLTAEQSGADVPAQASAKHPAGPKKQALRILNPGELSGDLKDPDDPWGYSHPRCRGLPTCSDSTSSPAVKRHQAGVSKGTVDGSCLSQVLVFFVAVLAKVHRSHFSSGCRMQWKDQHQYQPLCTLPRW